jgi:hypothetical protein
MTSWAEISEEKLDAVLDDATTTGLNTLGAKAGLAPLAWKLAASELTMHHGPDREPVTTPRISVTGNVPETGPETAEVARAWGRLLDLAEATHGPAGQLIFAGHIEQLLVQVMAVVDPVAFREHNERGAVERKRTMDAMRQKMGWPEP